jgi:branched-chain amino acid transport system substrate-binding protein
MRGLNALKSWVFFYLFTFDREMVMGCSRRLAVLSGGMALLMGLPAWGQTGAPIRIGSTLALTGPFSATTAMQKLAGEIFVEQLNKRGGLLGRPVEWVLKDDQSKPELTRALYEKLITDDKVDLVIGPYGTGAILSAMGVAQRFNKIILHNTFGLPSQAKYDWQFSVSGGAYEIEKVWPKLVFDSLANTPKKIKKVAIVTSKFPSAFFVSQGAREELKRRGLEEVIYLDWEFGNRDFASIAARVKDSNPDFLWIGGLGAEGNFLIDAMKKIDYTPPLSFVTFPAPSLMTKSPNGEGVLALTVFEEHPPFSTNPVAASFMAAFHEKGKAQNLADPSVDLMASVAYATWQTLEAAVNATKSLDDKTLASWIKMAQVDTIIGKMRWDGTNNFMNGDDLYKIKQVQGGKWVVIWPKEFAAPGVKLVTP